MIIQEPQLHHNARAKPIEYYIDSEGCWICTSHAKDKDGYPRICRNKKWTSVHRYVYELLVKKIEGSLSLLHSCDKRDCIKPICMFEGTQADNILDRESKRRGYDTKGINNGCARLTEIQVLELRRLYSTGLFSQSSLARLFNLSITNTRRILIRELWRHI